MAICVKIECLLSNKQLVSILIKWFYAKSKEKHNYAQQSSYIRQCLIYFINALRIYNNIISDDHLCLKYSIKNCSIWVIRKIRITYLFKGVAIQIWHVLSNRPYTFICLNSKLINNNIDNFTLRKLSSKILKIK